VARVRVQGPLAMALLLLVLVMMGAGLFLATRAFQGVHPDHEPQVESFFVSQLRARSETTPKETQSKKQSSKNRRSQAKAKAKPKPLVVGPWTLEDSGTLSTANLKTFMERFVREPHPMGSPANRALAGEFVDLLGALGWQARLLPFSQPGPNLDSPRFGGKAILSKPEVVVSGENVLAYRPGLESCVVIIGGHYDTKRYEEFRFVGANDGGSSTALMLEMARLIPKVWSVGGASAENKASAKLKKKPTGTWRGCGLALVFFDGEESILPGWYDGQAKAGIEDNLYGSRSFVRMLEEGQLPWSKEQTILTMVIDMVGHRNQKIFITEGSDPAVGDQLESQRGQVDLRQAPFRVDDDHIPFARRGMRVVHMIDWTNLAEWHKPTDTPAIISYDKLAMFGDVLMRFLQLPRQEALARRSP
jgi:glutaminyl-peptide cyclotransferase